MSRPPCDGHAVPQWADVTLPVPSWREPSSARMKCLLYTQRPCATARASWSLAPRKSRARGGGYTPPLTTESPTTHTTDQHHVPMDPRAAELMPIHAARLALTRSTGTLWIGRRNAACLTLTNKLEVTGVGC